MSAVRKSLGVILVALVFVTSACGGGKKKDSSGQYGSDLLTGTTNTVAPDATTTIAAAPGVTAKKSTATTRKSSSGAPVTVAGKDPIPDAAKGPTGSFAGIMLAASSPAKKIIYEVMKQDGTEAPARALNHVVAQLKQFSGKPVDVQTTPLPDGPTTWSTDQLHTYADRYSRFKQGGDTAVFHALFVHGTLGGNGQVLGVASRGDVLSMFYDQYKNSGNPALSPEVVADCVVMHETGHVLGLVDLWLNLGRGDFRDDPAPGGHHSSNKGSVMYYAVDTTGLFTIFSGGPPTEYDKDDKADLQAIHDGAPKGARSRDARSS